VEVQAPHKMLTAEAQALGSAPLMEAQASGSIPEVDIHIPGMSSVVEEQALDRVRAEVQVPHSVLGAQALGLGSILEVGGQTLDNILVVDV